MSYHITINGRTLCKHRYCDAEQTREALQEDPHAGLCQHVWKESAEEVARVWRAFKGLRVEVREGSCPHVFTAPKVD